MKMGAFVSRMGELTKPHSYGVIRNPKSPKTGAIKPTTDSTGVLAQTSASDSIAKSHGFKNFLLTEIPKHHSILPDEGNESSKDIILIMHGLVRSKPAVMFSRDAWISVHKQSAELPSHIESYQVTYPAELRRPLKTWGKDLQKLRTEFKNMLIQLSTQGPLTDRTVNIFAHSMGTLIALGGLHDLEDAECENLRIGHVMMVAPPLQGSPNAVKAHRRTRNVQAKDLRPGSNYLKMLRTVVSNTPAKLQRFKIRFGVAEKDELIPSGSIQEWNKDTGLKVEVSEFKDMEHTPVIEPAFQEFVKLLTSTNAEKEQSANLAMIA
jgi:hypothetical protein